ncbi:translation initiation factor IF-6 [Methanopyrus sp.]
MTVVKASIHGDPNVGAWIAASEEYAVVAPKVPSDVVEKVEEALEVEVVRTTVAGSNLVGALLAVNSNGALFPRHAREHEIRAVRELGVEVDVLPSKMNAVGNLVLTNDHGALVHPDLDDHALEVIESVLGGEVVRGELGGVKTVGSAGVVNSKGAVVHPGATEEEIERVSEVLKVDVEVGTVNRGSPYVGVGVVVNSKGAVVGEDTTGPELARLEDALYLV